jgi:hypothetical protein
MSGARPSGTFVLPGQRSSRRPEGEVRLVILTISMPRSPATDLLGRGHAPAHVGRRDSLVTHIPTRERTPWTH